MMVWCEVMRLVWIWVVPWLLLWMTWTMIGVMWSRRIADICGCKECGSKCGVCEIRWGGIYKCRVRCDVINNIMQFSFWWMVCEWWWGWTILRINLGYCGSFYWGIFIFILVSRCGVCDMSAKKCDVWCVQCWYLLICFLLWLKPK